MLYIWGRNNNHLIRNNHKTTYSMPQKVAFGKQIIKCACGSDYIIFLTVEGQPHLLYQSTVYQLSDMPKLNDIATQDNLIIGVTKRGAKVIAWEFIFDKVLANQVKPRQIPVDARITSVSMNFGDIFLISDQYQVYHFKRNQWYETKAFSNVAKIKTKQKITQVASGQKANLFLTYDGSLLTSKKAKPTELSPIQSQEKFIKIAASDFYAAIDKSGNLYTWGNTMNGKIKTPMMLSKLSKKFVSVILNFQNGYALSDDGQAWIWGKNANGQLGVSDYQQRVKPFPLITLDSQNILSMFPGYGFACCIVQPHFRKPNARRYSENCVGVTVSNLNRNSIQTDFNSLTPEKSIKYQIPHVKKQKKTVQVANSTTATIVQNSQSIRNQKIKKCYQTKKQEINKNAKKCHSRTSSLVKTNRSVTPKTPKGKNQENKENKQKFSRQDVPKSSMNGNNNKNNSFNKCGKIILNSAKFVDQQSYNRQREMNILRQENYRLISKVQQKELIITDLVSKMRILQAAIDQHERGLSSRDNLVQEYERRERQYLSHIDELQKSLHKYIKQKSAPSSAHQAFNDFNHLYDDLKINFQKEREYYIQKLREYQNCFTQERQRYQSKIKELQDEVCSFRDNKVSARRLQDRFLERSMGDVDRTIQRIEENKHKISRSANKLVQILDLEALQKDQY